MKKRDVPGPYNVEGDWVKVVMEIGPVKYYERSEADLLAAQERLRRELERYARAVMSVGPRSKVVTSRLEIVRDA